MYAISSHWVDLCGLQDSLAWFWIHDTIGMQKFCDICKYHGVKSDKNFSDMTKLLNWAFLFLSLLWSI